MLSDEVWNRIAFAQSQPARRERVEPGPVGDLYTLTMYRGACTGSHRPAKRPPKRQVLCARQLWNMPPMTYGRSLEHRA